MENPLHHGLAKDTDPLLQWMSLTLNLVKAECLLLGLSDGILTGCGEVPGWLHCSLVVLIQEERLENLSEWLLYMCVWIFLQNVRCPKKVGSEC